MKIRRYLGNNTQEAILKVKMDLGSEAIILNTRKVRKKGIFNFFTKPMVEVLAAVDDDYGKKDSQQKEAIVNRINAAMVEKSAANSAKTDSTDKDVRKKNNFDKKEENISELENKVNNMEVMLERIYQQLQPSAEKADAPQGQTKKKSDIQDILQLFYKNMVKNEVDTELAKELINMAMERVSTPSVNEAATELYKIMREFMGKPEEIKLREDGKPTVVLFVGPTGVGKTTTLAKIAASYSLNQKKEVGLITADTYRIAAVEQLKTYAEILNIPATVIYSVSELEDAIEAYSDKDVILIDTAGRSHRNKAQFEELKALVAAVPANETYLVLSATISNSNCREIIDNYSFLEDYRIIFTKLDEAPVSGVIFNTKLWTSKTLSYVTTGQSVPDDIEVANIEKIIKILLGSIS